MSAAPLASPLVAAIAPDTRAATPRYEAAALREAAAALFHAAGTPTDKAAAMAEVLVESDLMGHVTHGLGLVPKYLEEIEAGRMRLEGEPTILADRGACLTWDGRALPGGWLTLKALDLAMERVKTHGTVSIAIGNTQHIGCLAVYPARAAARGLLCILHSSAPGTASVAPFGARQGVLAPDPMAVGYPLPSGAVVTDISASITTNNMSLRLMRQGGRFPHPWLMEADGTPTDDPAAITRGGTILPAGGLDHGQKGYGWALVTEALTQGLSGFGRVEKPAGMLASVFLQVIDPEAFAGLDAFTRQTGHTAEACRAAAPRPGLPPVRLPGERGLALREAALRDGVALAPGIMEALQPLAARLGVTLPDARRD
ncbi:Ldh family oxidoreductase [Roseomonas sp. GC11]|uniref:Ldh family oxidoreductase n=1 Tax=Roseomonas sp. GC11 TaxID=2950546 RepID=UPI00210E5FA5|nr:Ldh family oxidoreductase [Roseomonas sp. GC11]MCQ4162462.1 Ldh family oxidoreductase [Roseomonas sp. GC11]